jgi:hypothetical protein
VQSHRVRVVYVKVKKRLSLSVVFYRCGPRNALDVKDAAVG